MDDDGAAGCRNPSLDTLNTMDGDLEGQLDRLIGQEEPAAMGRSDQEQASDSAWTPQSHGVSNLATDLHLHDADSLDQAVVNDLTNPLTDEVFPTSTSYASVETVRATLSDDEHDTTDADAARLHSLRSRRARRGRVRAPTPAARRETTSIASTNEPTPGQGLLPPFEMNVRPFSQSSSAGAMDLPPANGASDDGMIVDRFRHILCSSSLLATRTPQAEPELATAPSTTDTTQAPDPQIPAEDQSVTSRRIVSSPPSSLPLLRSLHRLDIYVAFLVALTGLGQLLGRLGLEVLGALAVLTCTLVGVVFGSEERKKRTPKKGKKHVELPQVEEEVVEPSNAISSLERFIAASERLDRGLARQSDTSVSEDRAADAIKRAIMELRQRVDPNAVQDLERLYGINDAEDLPPATNRLSLVSPRPTSTQRRPPRSPLGHEILLDSPQASPRFRLRPLRLSQSSRGSIHEPARPMSAIERPSRRSSALVVGSRRTSESPPPADMQDFINGLPIDLVHALKAQSDARASVSSMGSRPISLVEPKPSPTDSLVRRRRRLACHLLALSDPDASIAALDVLSTTFEQIAASLPNEVSFAPHFSDRQLFTSHLSVMSSLVRDVQSQLDTFSNEQSMEGIACRWDTLRNDLGGMITEWERARQVLRRSTAKPPSPRQDLPEFFQHWDEADQSASTDHSSLPDPPQPHAADEAQVVDDATAHLLETSTSDFLPPPGGVESVFESVAGERVHVRPAAKLSREERIAAAKRERKQEQTREPTEASKMGEMVHELKDVIGELRKRRQALMV